MTTADSLTRAVGNPKAKSMQYYSAHRKTEYCKYMSRKAIAFWAMNIMRWFSLESPVVECRYVFTRFKSENDLSLTVTDSFPRIEISLNSFLRELSRDCKKVTKSLTSNSEVSNPIDSVVCGESKSCP